MSREVIAVIQLQPGQGGYYDDLSRIHLTIGSPRANVYAGTNCTQLRRSLRAGRIKLVTGSLGAEVPPFKLVRHGNNYILQHNDLAEKVALHTGVKAEEEKAAVKAPVEAKAEPEVVDAPAKTKKDEKAAKAADKGEVVEETSDENSAETDTAEEAVEEGSDEKQEDEKEAKAPAKRRGRKAKSAAKDAE